MSNFEVERSNLIRKPAEEVYAAVRDFTSWPKWSPWLCAEPGCPLEFSPDGKSYSWDGEIVGAGEMKVIAERENEFIEYELTMLKPWKSTSNVRFQFGREGDRTRVTWVMKGKLPVYLFWMKAMMVSAIGMDYKRGLAMLKDYLQKGKVPSDLEFMGQGEFAGLSYVGMKNSCRITDIAEKMEADLLRLKKWVQDQHITPSGTPLSIYHKWSLTQGTTSYTIAFPVEKVPGWLPENFVSGKIPTCQVQRIRHTGSYLHLGNTWSAGMAAIRAKKWKSRRGIHPFETYDNDPSEVAEEDLVTTVHFPMAEGKG